MLGLKVQDLGYVARFFCGGFGFSCPACMFRVLDFRVQVLRWVWSV